jgi:hypothetical protein
MPEARVHHAPDVLVLARDISDAVEVGGVETVAAAVALDPGTGLILGSGVAADPVAALKDLLANVSGGASATRSGPPRLLCRPELVSMVAGCLPAAWRRAEVVAMQPDHAVDDLFDSLVGHLSGRRQPEDFPSPADWVMLLRQAQAFVEARPWQQMADDVHLNMHLRLSGIPTQAVGIVMGNAGITYGFALYPGAAPPPTRLNRTRANPAPPGTLAMTLDPATELPGYLVARARRYGWPDSLELVPVFFAWTAEGPADLSSDQVALLTLALAAALASRAEGSLARAAGDMILSGGRSGQYQVASGAPAAEPSAARGPAFTIDRALEAFLEDSRSRLSARTARTYESVIELLRACLNSYGHQYLSEAELAAFEAAYQAGDEQAFCRLFGAEKIVESVGEFLGYFMVRKVAASEELLRASGTVSAKLVAWLAERGAVSPAEARDAQRRAQAAARDLPRAARLASVLFEAAESGPAVRVDALDDADYVEDELTISRVEPGKLWFEDDIGPVKVPKAASDLARPGWTISLALGRVRGQWRLLQVGNVYP